LPFIFKISGPRRRAVLLGLLTFLLLAFLSFHRMGELLEYSWLDLLYTWRAPEPPPPQLLIVGIDEPSFQELGKPWPWPRRLHAALVQRLVEAGARLVVFDVVFADPTAPEDDADFARVLRQTGKVILAEDLDIVKDPHFSREILVQPYKPLRQAALALGLAVVQPDPDGVVRHFNLKIGGKDTLAAAAVRAYEPQLKLPQQVSGLIHYAGPPRSLDTVSYYQVLDKSHPLPAARLKGRLVLVGRMLGASPSPQARSDSFYTPYYAVSGQITSGVELHGQIIHTLLSRSWGRELPAGGRLGLYFLVTLLAAYGLARLAPLPGLAVLLGAALVILGVSAGLFLWLNFWAPPVLLAAGLGLIYAGNILGHYLIEAREKRWLRQAFHRYLSPTVVEAIIAHPERLRLGGEEVEGTVLFADLAGFTAISENMAPGELIRLLNEYFSPLTDIILAHQGTLDKYIGDALMAFWGAPLPLKDHALKACQAVLAIKAAMPELQEGWSSRGLPLLTTRMGLHSGPLIAGNVGSRDRFNYTILGDTVNLASRLEAVNKIYGTGVLLSAACHHLVRGDFLVRELDLLKVYGRRQPVAIYELLGEAASGAPDWLAAFAEGLKNYRGRHWDRAEACFLEVLRLKPDDPPARLFLNRIKHFRLEPPPGSWSGVYVMEGK
jgi:adenylate cyclase